MSNNRRPYIGPSEAQANAEALARRGAPYAGSSDASFRQAWDWRRREPVNLREAVRMVRRAYADEVPAKLHEGPDSIGEGGTPKMTARAEGYIFGSPRGSDVRHDPETGQPDLISYYHSPFRARLDELAHGDDTQRLIAQIVSHVTIGGRGPKEAAIEEGVLGACAHWVAEAAIRAFLRGITDLKLHVREPLEPAGVAAPA